MKNYHNCYSTAQITPDMHLSQNLKKNADSPLREKTDDITTHYLLV